VKEGGLRLVGHQQGRAQNTGSGSSDSGNAGIDLKLLTNRLHLSSVFPKMGGRKAYKRKLGVADSHRIGGAGSDPGPWNKFEVANFLLKKKEGREEEEDPSESAGRIAAPSLFNIRTERLHPQEGFGWPLRGRSVQRSTCSGAVEEGVTHRRRRDIASRTV